MRRPSSELTSNITTRRSIGVRHPSGSLLGELNNLVAALFAEVASLWGHYAIYTLSMGDHSNIKRVGDMSRRTLA